MLITLSMNGTRQGLERKVNGVLPLRLADSVPIRLHGDAVPATAACNLAFRQGPWFLKRGDGQLNKKKVGGLFLGYIEADTAAYTAVFLCSFFFETYKMYSFLHRLKIKIWTKVLWQFPWHKIDQHLSTCSRLYQMFPNLNTKQKYIHFIECVCWNSCNGSHVQNVWMKHTHMFSFCSFEKEYLGWPQQELSNC